MLGLIAPLRPVIHFSISSTLRIVCIPPPSNHLTFASSILKTHIQIPTKPKGFVVFAESKNGLSQDSKEKEKKEETGEIKGNGSNGGDDDELGKDRRSIFSSIRWGDLLLDPDPDNIVAVGLAGLLTWASVQVLWQLFFISFAILVAALKYSFIAALLVFILITLL